MQQDDLERLIDRELRALPAPRAPRSLLPRVMAAVAARHVMPWYRRGWANWPPLWQVASLVAVVALSAGVVVSWPYLSTVAATLRPDVGAFVPSQVRALTGAVAEGLDATRVLWRVLVEPVIGYVVAFVLTMFLACVAFGTALDRVALGGPSEL